VERARFFPAAVRLSSAACDAGAGAGRHRLRAHLDQLPVITCWPKDGGRFITFPLVVSRHPRSGKTNVGIYRMQVFDRATTGMHWQIHKGGGFHYHIAEQQGSALPVAVALGADPALMIAGIFPLPEALEEIAFAGILSARRTRLVAARTIPLDVPADAEFVLEGVVAPHERRAEGPFGDHFGHYCDVADFRCSTCARSRGAASPSTPPR
jgi:4-hydroxy-3-polyprenylbenzoate decarboxylase